MVRRRRSIPFSGEQYKQRLEVGVHIVFAERGEAWSICGVEVLCWKEWREGGKACVVPDAFSYCAPQWPGGWSGSSTGRGLQPGCWVPLPPAFSLSCVGLGVRQTLYATVSSSVKWGQWFYLRHRVAVRSKRNNHMKCVARCWVLGRTHYTISCSARGREK